MKYEVLELRFPREERGEPSISIMGIPAFLSEEDAGRMGSARPPETIRERDAGILTEYLKQVPGCEDGSIDLYEGQLESELEQLLAIYDHHGWTLCSTTSRDDSSLLLFLQRSS